MKVDSEAFALWSRLQQAAQVANEAVLQSWIERCITVPSCLSAGLALLLAEKLATAEVSSAQLEPVFTDYLQRVETQIAVDLAAIYQRDPAIVEPLTPFLFLKGFHALQSYRVAHGLWQEGRNLLALWIQSRASEVFAVDIHPAARLGQGLLLDHATGIVIGETAVVEDNVSILQGVTLGGTGKEHGDRHPKIRSGVLLSTGAIVLGNIEIAKNAKVAAGSVVLKSVTAHTTVAGVPAKIVGRFTPYTPALEMDHEFDIHI